MLFFRNLACSNLTCKYDRSFVDLRFKVAWMLLFSSFYWIVSRNDFLGVKFESQISKFFCFLLSSSMKLSTQLLLPFYIINISSIYQRYIRCGRDISWNWSNFHKLFFRIFSITTRSSRPEESPLAESYSSKVRDVSPVTLL